MRLWTIHPKYLDTKGLLAAWREALLAQKVLEGKTKGYTNHPQLNRFKNSQNPLPQISNFLFEIAQEAQHRKYNFDYKKINHHTPTLKEKIQTTETQIQYEWELLKQKLEIRDQNKLLEIIQTEQITTTSIFKIIPGPIENWEKTIPDIILKISNQKL